MKKVICPILKYAQSQPDTPAIFEVGRTFTYAESDRRINEIMLALHSNGITSGQVVLLKMPPSADYVFLLWALFRLGAIACPINPAFPETMLNDCIDRIAPDKILTSFPFPSSTPPSFPSSNPPSFPSSGLGTHTPEAPASERLKQHATIILSSGSSGTPKAIVHDLANHITCALRSNQNIPLHPGDCWLLSLPLYHISGMATLFRCFMAGAAVGIPKHRGALSEALIELPITHLSLVPAQLQPLMADAATLSRLQHCKAILLGGSTIPESLLCDAVQAKLPIHTTYGMTEMASQVCTTPPQASLLQLRSSGKPLANDSIRINDAGEIEVGGKTLFKGYWVKGALHPPTLQNGFFQTGDLGCFDDAGFLHVLGRKDNMFISGGENIQPETVEKALNQYDAVKNSLCVPVPDERLGYVPTAFIKTEGSINEEALNELLKKQLPKYALPRRIFSWPANQEVSGIKINRKHFQELAEKMTADEMLRNPDQKSGK